jgi:dTDP-4-dehydrorhamnose 3,5-epimerase-like enzyme
MQTAQNSTVFDISVLTLPKIEAEKGNITSLNNLIEIPFETKRVYFLYDIPAGETRGGHAHKELYQVIVAVSGSFDVIIFDGKNKRTVHLSRPNMGLLMPPGLWREIDNFSSGSICLVLASLIYDEGDYIREIDNFKNFKL